MKPKIVYRNISIISKWINTKPKHYLFGYLFSKTDLAEFDPESDKFTKSMFVFNCGGNLLRKDIPEVLTLSGKYDDGQFPYNVAPKAYARDEQLLPNSIFYCWLWKFDQL